MKDTTIKDLQELNNRYVERFQELQEKYLLLQDDYTAVISYAHNLESERNRANEAEAKIIELERELNELKHPTQTKMKRVANKIIGKVGGRNG